MQPSNVLLVYLAVVLVIATAFGDSIAAHFSSRPRSPHAHTSLHSPSPPSHGSRHWSSHA
jgi:hypothetical protein